MQSIVWARAATVDKADTVNMAQTAQVNVDIVARMTHPPAWIARGPLSPSTLSRKGITLSAK